MARLEDIPEPTRTAVANLPCPAFDTTPFVPGPELSERRVAIVSSAALIHRGDTPFPFGSGEFRAVPEGWSNTDILMSHVSINYDRSGFQRDINVVWDLAPHDFSIMDYIIGEQPEAVVATGGNHFNDLADMAYITVNKANSSVTRSP